MDWRKHWANTDVFRTLTLFDRDRRAPRLVGPFVIDIDVASDLAYAKLIARRTLKALEARGVPEQGIRAYFSGHKGFNVEVRPEALGLESAPATFDFRPWRLALESIMKEVNAKDLIDHIVGSRPCYKLKHRHLRLVGSKNAWLDSSGGLKARRKTAIVLEDLL